MNLKIIKVVAVVATCIIVFLSIILYMAINDIIFRSDLVTKEWDNLKKDTLNDFDFIKRMSIGSSTTALSVSCRMNREAEKQEVEKVFERIRGFILSSEEFEFLKKKHIEKYGGEFIRIYIRFDSPREDDESDYEFFSSINNSGEVTPDSFNKWIIKVNGEVSEDYLGD